MGQYGKYRPLVTVACLGLAGGLGAAAPAAACRLALVLAIDVSSSVDAQEDALQRSGLAAALLAPEVQDAFFAAPEPVALAAFEWSGRYNQANLFGWLTIRNSEDLYYAAGLIGRSTRSHDDFPTAVGHALGHAAVMLQERPDCLFHTIDMAGDGVNNEGFGPEEAYGAFPFDGVVVNGLVVDTGDYGDSSELMDFYQDRLRRGPGAFVEVAQGFADYEAAMRRKLLRELQVVVVGARPMAAGPRS